jgi:hypothetical protein
MHQYCESIAILSVYVCARCIEQGLVNGLDGNLIFAFTVSLATDRMTPALGVNKLLHPGKRFKVL